MEVARMKLLKVPKLRFREFEGEWSNLFLGNTCSVQTGNKDTQNREDDGIYPFYVRSNTIEKISTYSFDGEAILTSGDGVGVGKNFHYVNEKFDYHQRVYALHTFKSGYNGKFIYFLFAEKFFKRVMRLSAKNSVDSVRRDMITKMLVFIPTLPEQQKIAGFLSAVDEKLKHLNRKKELLQQYKKGVMQKLFSQELRFKREDGSDYEDWEEKRLDEVATFYNGRAYKQDELLDKGKYTVLRVGNFFTNENWYYSDLELEENKYCNNGDLLYAWSASFGPRIWEGDDRTIYHYHIWKVDFKQNVTKEFLFQILKIETEKMKAAVLNGFALQHITKGAIEKWKCFVPSIPEQQKIADFLSGLDEKIDAVSAQIELTQQFKKGLLQEMFV